ncbi:hypothetical protein BC938DRAFT_473297 [Jimgerdemannia flammicorona]|uniref:Dol-P-Glc:Glc(2)Man(9)GlcNAc(2)-PP-Dol alpha-1,2-glucosyltransferase n=1 Tax=Jimgerdemannia flammicorona TaxID=994334 RepID=A0A433QTD4_9FUNG|nr:hypothetical protein BC938DRAFT_473297 [Jimgerdemannia flammicorona]
MMYRPGSHIDRQPHPLDFQAPPLPPRAAVLLRADARGICRIRDRANHVAGLHVPQLFYFASFAAFFAAPAILSMDLVRRAVLGPARNTDCHGGRDALPGRPIHNGTPLPPQRQPSLYFLRLEEHLSSPLARSVCPRSRVHGRRVGAAPATYHNLTSPRPPRLPSGRDADTSPVPAPRVPVLYSTFSDVHGARACTRQGETRGDVCGIRGRERMDGVHVLVEGV